MKVFAIELTNWCNAKCSFCPYPTPAHTRQRGFMDLGTLDKIIELATEPKGINLSGLGEPTLHKQLVPFTRVLVESGFRVQMNTNGKRLDQRMYDQLVEAGLCRIVLTSDYFPWDKGRLSVVEALPITFFTITREPDHPEMGQTRKPLDDWAGQVGNARHGEKKLRCSFLHDDFVQITWDGRVQRCCADFNTNHMLGSIHDNEFVTRLQAGHYAGIGIPLCEGCSGYVFKDGIVAGDYAGDGTQTPDAFATDQG